MDSFFCFIQTHVETLWYIFQFNYYILELCGFSLVLYYIFVKVLCSFILLVSLVSNFMTIVFNFYQVNYLSLFS